MYGKTKSGKKSEHHRSHETSVIVQCHCRPDYYTVFKRLPLLLQAGRQGSCAFTRAISAHPRAHPSLTNTEPFAPYFYGCLN
uniref:Uncharacterized protein n=1 Tax=Anopheles quadriannulatus TaxID=34691 RepID=A0A182XT36_ANOQN